MTAATIAAGLSAGLGIAALAIGLVLVHRASRVINLAHAELGAAAATGCAALVRDDHVPFVVAATIATLGAAATAALVETVVIRRLRVAPRPVALIATAGVAEMLLAASILGAGTIANRGGGFPSPWQGSVDLGSGVLLGGGQLALLALVPLVALLLVGAGRFTSVGIAIRAASDNEEAARLAGLPVARLDAAVWAAAGGLASLVAICLLAGHPIVGTESLGPELLFEALAACVIARFASLAVAVASGVAIGVLQAIVQYHWPDGGMRDLVLLVVVAVALMARRRDPVAEDQAVLGLLGGVLARVPRDLGRRQWWRAMGPAAAAIALVSAAIASLWASNSQVLTLSEIAAYAILAVSTTLVVGVAGHVSLGQVAFFGLGAAVSYRLSVFGAVPFWLAFLGAGVVVAVAAVAVGLPALRGRGLLFAVTSLGFALVAQNWLLAQPWLLGAGVTIPRPIIGPWDLAPQRSYFLFALAALGGAAWVARNLLRSGTGRRIVAVRDNQAAAASFAVPLVRTKVLAFAVAGFLAGIAGAVYGHGLQSVSVNDFPVANPGLQIGAVDSLRMVAIVVIGGLGSAAGAVVAAALIIGVDELTTSVPLRLLTTSTGLLVVLLALPGGLAGLVHPVRSRAMRLVGAAASGPGPP